MIRALPKPRPIISAQKPNRLPKGKAVSIGLGFRCDRGVVLCSDTQITWKGRHKAHESKLFYLSGHDWTMASVYAGDPHLWRSFKGRFHELVTTRPHGKAATTGELGEIVETALCYFDDLDNDPLALCLIVGIVIPSKEIALIKTEGKVASEIAVFDYVGCGDSSVLRYLASITADKDAWMTIDQALYTGTHWVRHAKTYVEDCGGDTDAFVLHWNGGMQSRSEMTYNWEQHILRLERDVASLRRSFWDVSVSDAEFGNKLGIFCQRLKEERQLHIR